MTQLKLIKKITHWDTIYKLVKKLNTIIKPYMPSKYHLKSTNYISDILRSNNYAGYIASLNVESFFINVLFK